MRRKRKPSPKDDADRRFEPVTFRLFASNAGYGTGRHAAVALSAHGPVQSIAPYPQGFTLDRRFSFRTPPYEVAVAAAPGRRDQLPLTRRDGMPEPWLDPALTPPHRTDLIVRPPSLTAVCPPRLSPDRAGRFRFAAVMPSRKTSDI